MGEGRLDPRTPVVVGVGQSSERLGEPGHQALSPVELGAAAAREALHDSAGDVRRLARALDTVAAVRQFEVSTPWARAPLGRSDNYPRSVARRLGADPRRAVLDVVGGQSPQHLVTTAAAEIAAGTAELVLVVGAEAISTVRHLAGTPGAPDFTESVGGQLDDRGLGVEGLLSPDVVRHGLASPPAAYAVCENARRTRLGLSRSEYAQVMGELFAPFTRVAARNRHAAAPVVRSAEELVTPTSRNRWVADPYPRYLVARDQVNQGAAVLVASLAAAERLGVPEERWVFLPGHADLQERELLDRQDLGRAPASVLAARHALELAGVGVDDVATFDFYSCFPVAVLATAVDGLGLSADDPRGLTVTGGLPFFGGPGNAYSLHAIAETVQRVRADPGSMGFVGANGGFLSKYSAGVYSCQPAPWRADDSVRLQAEVDAWAAPARVEHPDGPARVETWTTTYDREGARTGIVVGRSADDGRRFVATTAPGDDGVLDLLTGEDPAGAPVVVRSTPAGNVVSA